MPPVIITGRFIPVIISAINAWLLAFVFGCRSCRFWLGLLPYLLVVMLVSAIALGADSALYAAIAALQVFGWILAILGLRYRIPALHRVAAPAAAMLMLNAAAVVGLYKFLFTAGPLWKIWNSGKPVQIVSALETENVTPAQAVVATLERNSRPGTHPRST